MEPFPVVEQFDIPESGLPHVFDVLEVTPVGHRKSLRDLYFCASVMPEHKQACVGRNSRLVDFCHCFTFWGCAMIVSRVQRKHARMFTLPRRSVMHLVQ